MNFDDSKVQQSEERAEKTRQLLPFFSLISFMHLLVAFVALKGANLLHYFRSFDLQSLYKEHEVMTMNRFVENVSANTQ